MTRAGCISCLFDRLIKLPIDRPSLSIHYIIIDSSHQASGNISFSSPISAAYCVRGRYGWNSTRQQSYKQTNNHQQLNNEVDNNVTFNNGNISFSSPISAAYCVRGQYGWNSTRQQSYKHTNQQSSAAAQQ